MKDTFTQNRGKFLFLISIIDCVCIYWYVGWWFLAYVLFTYLIFYNLSNLFLMQTPMSLGRKSGTLNVTHGYRTIFYNSFFLVFLGGISASVIVTNLGAINWMVVLIAVPIGAITGISFSRLFTSNTSDLQGSQHDVAA